MSDFWLDNLRDGGTGNDKATEFFRTHGPMVERAGRQAFAGFLEAALAGDENASDVLKTALASDEWLHKIAGSKDNMKVWRSMTKSFLLASKGLLDDLDSATARKILLMVKI